MRCSKAQEYLSLEMDGVLPPAVTTSLQEHLDACGDCRAYRGDLQLGRRLLTATEPSLSDNFEWKLQLRLNQALKETAGEVAYPWADQPADSWAWVRNFGAAAAMGLAAVLAVAVFVGPFGQPTPGPAPVSVTRSASLSGDRLPLESRFAVGGQLGRPVSTASPFQQSRTGAGILDRSWSGQNLDDLRTINRLRAQNEQLGRALFHTQRQLQMMRAQLDSTGKNALDLHGERE